MKTISIKFVGFSTDFNYKENFITKILSKYYCIEISDAPDFLFYGPFGDCHLKFNNCVKIFYTGENITPDFNECDYAIGFDYIKFDDRYMRRRIDVIRKQNYYDCLSTELCRRKFCNFIYYNEISGEGSKLRKDFCIKLAQYKNVDCPGRVLNNMVDAITPRFENRVRGKMDFIKQYKFTIAFENSSSIGYVTEKSQEPLNAYTVPIYWGDPEVAREFNPKSFVNCHDFKNFDEVIEYVIFLDNNDDAYLAMLRQTPMQPDYVSEPDKFEKFLINIIEKGNKPFSKDPRNCWDSKKQKIKDLLHECCTLQLKFGDVHKVKEHALLALKLQSDLVWPCKYLKDIYMKDSSIIDLHEFRDNILFCEIYADTCIKNKDYTEAKDVALYALQAWGEKFWAYKIICQCQLACGENDLALVSASKALELVPAEPHLIHNISCLMLAHKLFDKAEELARKALTFTQHPQFYITISSACQGNENFADAITFAQKACKLSPENVTYQSRLVQLLQNYPRSYPVDTTLPPRIIPRNLIASYTLDFSFPVIDYYLDNTVSKPVHITSQKYETVLKKISDDSFYYYGTTLKYLRSAFDKYPLKGKCVLIYGLEGCNCDALSLFYGADEVYVVDYNKPICDHPQVKVLSMDELDGMQLNVDIGISISSFEHDGLGRYGDPLDPDGDLKAMQKAKKHLKKDGILFLAVPIGRDCVAWNAHRIYGEKRFKLLCKDWTCLDAFGYTYDLLLQPFGLTHQPVFVLQNTFMSGIHCNHVKTLFDETKNSKCSLRLLKHKRLFFEYVILRNAQATALNQNRFIIEWNIDMPFQNEMAYLLRILRPHSVNNIGKVRIGGNSDGGYVMLEPGNAGIAYSFGVSMNSPWAIEMAERGYIIFQYGGTINQAPKKHEKLIFSKFNISGKTNPSSGSKNLTQILTDHDHDDENNIILQMDIEGAEWEFFESITEKQIKKFRQIVVVFHNLLSPNNIKRYRNIFEKILLTHTVIHFHYNNNGTVRAFDTFCASSLFEISFVRKDDHVFTPCNRVYPTNLDFPCVGNLNDVYIGKFEQILLESGISSINRGTAVIMESSRLKLSEVENDNSRLLAINNMQSWVNNSQWKKAPSARLGGMFLQSISSVGNFIALPKQLFNLFLDYTLTNPSSDLGGESFSKVITSYETEGFDGVVKVLARTRSPKVRGDAYTVLARHLRDKKLPTETAKAARYAFEEAPQHYRLKWLAFRLHDAGEIFEAEACLSLLPESTTFEGSDATQRIQLLNDAKKKLC